MMLSDDDLFDAITLTALRGCDVDVKARKEIIWGACIAMMSECLRESDPLSRERLLRGLVLRLRESIVHLDQLLRPSPCNPFETRSPFKLN